MSINGTFSDLLERSRRITSRDIRARGELENLERDKWIDAQPRFEKAHFLDGFAYRDGRFRFRPDWTSVPNANAGAVGPWGVS